MTKEVLLHLIRLAEHYQKLNYGKDTQIKIEARERGAKSLEAASKSETYLYTGGYSPVKKTNMKPFSSTLKNTEYNEAQQAINKSVKGIDVNVKAHLARLEALGMIPTRS